MARWELKEIHGNTGHQGRVVVEADEKEQATEAGRERALEVDGIRSLPAAGSFPAETAEPVWEPFEFIALRLFGWVALVLGVLSLLVAAISLLIWLREQEAAYLSAAASSLVWGSLLGLAGSAGLALRSHILRHWER